MNEALKISEDNRWVSTLKLAHCIKQNGQEKSSVTANLND